VRFDQRTFDFDRRGAGVRHDLDRVRIAHRDRAYRQCARRLRGDR
jgi:hypothetical protein